MAEIVVEKTFGFSVDLFKLTGLYPTPTLIVVASYFYWELVDFLEFRYCQPK